MVTVARAHPRLVVDANSTVVVINDAETQSLLNDGEITVEFDHLTLTTRLANLYQISFPGRLDL